MIWNFLIPHIKDLQTRNITVECACSKTGFYFEELEEKYGLVLHKISFSRSPYNISNIKCLLKLISLIKKNNFDVIHCHEPVGGAMGRVAGFITGCKVIYTAHGFHFFKGNSWLNNFIYKNVESLLARFTDILITINDEDYNAAKTFCVKRGGGIYKISGIGCNIKKIQALHIDRVRKRRDLGIGKDTFVVITTAELIDRKKINIGIKAFIDAKIDNSIYLICGDGKEEKKLKRLVEDQNIRFLGFRKDIHELNAIADVCLFPSNQEGLSIAVIEAMAAGLKMVVSDARGVKDCIVNDKSGIICNRNKVEDFSVALIFMYKQKRNSEYYTFNRKYSEKYDIDNILKEMNYIYNKHHL